MKISEEDIQKIAKLANLTVSETEVKLLSKQLAETITFVDKLKSISTNKVPPTSQTTGLKNIFREDAVMPSLSQNQSLANAKKSAKGYFVTQSIF